MPSASDLQPDDRFIALFVGAKHSGKTVAAASMLSGLPENKMLHFLDFDGRIRGLLGAPWIDRKRITYKYYPPRTGNNDKPVYQQINSDMEGMLAQCNIGQSPYGGIIADSLTAQTFALVCDAMPLTHKDNKGKRIGVLNMAGPEDYGFEATGTYNLMAFLRSLPFKVIIVTAHLIDKFGKANPNDPYSESIVTGEKLSIRDKIGTNIGIYFDHIFRFERRMVGSSENFFVRFRSSIACTSYDQLPEGEINITGKSFHSVLMEYLKGEVK